jgi:hypothetical protein
MKLLDIIPKLGELALLISPITSPYAKVASCGLGLTILARTSIKERQAKNRSKKLSNLSVAIINGTIGAAILFVSINNNAKLSFVMGLAGTTIAEVVNSTKSGNSESAGERQNSKPIIQNN